MNQSELEAKRGKRTIGDKRGKICNRCKARETYNRRQARENTKPVLSAGNIHDWVSITLDWLKRKTRLLCLVVWHARVHFLNQL